MQSSLFTFEKRKVIQALRYHFISRREIRLLMILVNVFAVVAAALFYFKQVSPFAFLSASFLWIFLMVIFWFILPGTIYRRTPSFKETFKASIESEGLTLSTDKGSKSWSWIDFSHWTESPGFFHFYLTEKSFFLIPKDAFGLEQWQSIRSLCVEKIKKR